MAEISRYIDALRCPETGQALRLVSITDLEAELGQTVVPLRNNDLDKGDTRFGRTETVLIRTDMQRAYPIVDGIPILLVPEALGVENSVRRFNLHDPKYAEAYEEMGFYNMVSGEEAERITESTSFEIVKPVMTATQSQRDSFPNPRHVWIDATYDCVGQHEAYEYIAPIKNKRVVQLGGNGAHAVKFALGDAAESFSMTPMLGEAQCARAMARAAGVEDRVFYVVAVAEELPFADGIFDAAYTGGSLHHMVTTVAVPEIVRILKPAGRFASIDMWKAPLYTIGIKILGKREVDIHCKPLTNERVAPLAWHFSSSTINQHGTLTRYPFLALQKFGRPSAMETVWKYNTIDDRICSFIPGLRKLGSSVVSMGTK